ncbi:MAG: hypothetical protein HUU46_12065 [Candidatus Hydrogenedentes bacterium]|nr:hypothetical protein [Candidatus Hydrogenedentota bacterium]
MKGRFADFVAAARTTYEEIDATAYGDVGGAVTELVMRCKTPSGTVSFIFPITVSVVAGMT